MATQGGQFPSAPVYTYGAPPSGYPSSPGYVQFDPNQQQQHAGYGGGGSVYVSRDPMAFGPSQPCLSPKAKLVITSLVLAALAGVASYFGLVHGLQLYDTATTSLSIFGSGFLIYSGAIFSVVAVGNILYAGGKILCHDDEGHEPFVYKPSHMKYQIGISLLAPVAAVPAIIVMGLCAAVASGGGSYR